MADWTIIRILTWTESYFKDHSVDSPRLAAEILLAHALDIRRLDLYLQHDRPLEQQELSDFKALIKRRVQREPVAYITGERGFYDAEFKVAPGVLIPRPDTETLVETARESVEKITSSRPLRVLELGAGSGAVIVSLARAVPGHLYVAGDISLKALSLAKKNSDEIAGGQVSFFAGSWLDALKPAPAFDIIVSNPPYIPTGDIATLQDEIRKFEPMLALDGGRDGLDCYREIVSTAHRFLLPGGWLLLEMGFDQKEGLEMLCSQYTEYESIEFVRDLAGHNRVAKIKKMN